MKQPSDTSNTRDENAENPRMAGGMLTPANKKAAFWLIVWTANNIAVTLLNKAAFGTFVDFPYPYALTAVHMFVCAVASNLCSSSSTNNKAAGKSHPASPTKQKQQSAFATIAYSLLFTLNICLGNVSLRNVSINLNQVIRSLVPVFTLWLSDYCCCFTSSQASPQRRRAVWPVVLGVALACAGDLDDTALGVAITVACAMAAALKVVASSQLLTQGAFSPMELLRSMAPAACVQCLVLSVISREGIWELATTSQHAWWFWDMKTTVVVLLSGVAAFGLNITAFEAYRATSPVTCCIAASVKQVLLVAVATAIFHTNVTTTNCFGMALVLVSSAYYSYLSIVEKESRGNNADTGKDSDNSDDQSQRPIDGPNCDDEEQQQSLIVSPISREGALQRRL